MDEEAEVYDFPLFMQREAHNDVDDYLYPEPAESRSLTRSPSFTEPDVMLQPLDSPHLPNHDYIPQFYVCDDAARVSLLTVCRTSRRRIRHST